MAFLKKQIGRKEREERRREGRREKEGRGTKGGIKAENVYIAFTTAQEN